MNIISAFDGSIHINHFHPKLFLSYNHAYIAFYIHEALTQVFR